MTRQRFGTEFWVGVALILTAVVLLTGCSGSGGDTTPAVASTSACWQAMVTQYRTDEATGFTGTFPPACHGVPDAVLQDYAFQILDGNTGSPTP